MSALAGYVALTLVFGDAVRQSTPEKRARIESEVMPLVHDLAEPGITKAREVQLVQRILKGLMSIMGDSWQLADNTRKWINKLLYGVE